MAEKTNQIELLDVSELTYAERLTANSLQGLVNRTGAHLFLDYGNYDDPGTRKTNSVQMTEEDWFGKYRDVLKRNDLDNLDYYVKEYDFQVHKFKDLLAGIFKYRDLLAGMVVWDPEMLDSVNLALVYAGLEDLLVVHPEHVEIIQEHYGLEVKIDLQGRFGDRVSLYRWMFENLFEQCTPGKVAHYEPTWQRAEFTDTIVQNKLFSYSLACFKKGGLRSLGQKLLLLLVAGPLWLRNFLFTTRLDKVVRFKARVLLGLGSPETRLGTKILRSVIPLPYPTIFGWHTDRDDELAFMLAISANGLRLGPTFLANNYSFHSQLPAQVPFKQQYLAPDEVSLEDKVYLTFTLSDGDQFTLMNTAEVGNWRRPEHGLVPFNWEVQPLLVELAPALLGYYYQHLTPADMLIAGPSGAGYVIPPLVPNLPAYMQESARLCDLADIRITTSYTSNPPGRVIRDHAEAPGNFLGYIAGYFHLNKTPMTMAGKRPFVSYAWPHVTQIGLQADQVLAGIRRLVDAPGSGPRFIACHLFAYRTTVADVYQFVQTLDPQKVKVVRADEFLLAAEKFMHKEKLS
jgi:hypothetical protein